MTPSANYTVTAAYSAGNCTATLSIAVAAGASGTFMVAGTMAAARILATARLLSGGRVLVAGGFDGSS